MSWNEIPNKFDVLNLSKFPNTLNNWEYKMIISIALINLSIHIYLFLQAHTEEDLKPEVDGFLLIHVLRLRIIVLAVDWAMAHQPEEKNPTADLMAYSCLFLIK